MAANVHALTGAYVLNALEPAERAEFESHIGHCPNCEREVAELRATAARLVAAVSATPPPRLRTRVLAQITRTKQASPNRLRDIHSGR
jgi:anti-sigma factor RsiW